MNSNKNNFFIAISIALFGAFSYYLLLEDKIFDFRVVYSIQEKDLDSVQATWQTEYFEEPDFQAYIVPRYSSIYNQQLNKKAVFYFELVIWTNNEVKIDTIQQLYLSNQPMGFLNQKPVLYKTTLIRAAKPWNKTIGVFIVLLVVTYGISLLLNRSLLQNKE